MYAIFHELLRSSQYSRRQCLSYMLTVRWIKLCMRVRYFFALLRDTRTGLRAREVRAAAVLDKLCTGDEVFFPGLDTQEPTILPRPRIHTLVEEQQILEAWLETIDIEQVQRTHAYVPDLRIMIPAPEQSVLSIGYENAEDVQCEFPSYTLKRAMLQ